MIGTGPACVVYKKRPTQHQYDDDEINKKIRNNNANIALEYGYHVALLISCNNATTRCSNLSRRK